MSRKKRAPKRIPIVDPKFKSVVIPKLINSIMYDGKKTTAEKIVYDALNKIQLKVATSTIRTVEKKGGLDEYLINTSNSKLASAGLKLKKLILSKNN